MDVMTKVEESIKLLDEIDAYNNTLVDKLSELDCKEQDLLHYIEDNKINYAKYIDIEAKNLTCKKVENQ